jgi:hypothetical protein
MNSSSLKSISKPPRFDLRKDVVGTPENIRLREGARRLTEYLSRMDVCSWSSLSDWVTSLPLSNGKRLARSVQPERTPSGSIR